MLISLVVVTRNRSQEILNLLNSVNKLNFSSLEIIIVDNNSEDNTGRVVKTFFKDSKYEYQYIRLEDNVGATGGRNIGYKKSRGKYVLFTDDDVYFEDKKFLTRVYQFMEANPEVGIMQTGIYNIKEEKYQEPIYNKEKKNGSYYPAFNFIGASHIVRKTALQKGARPYLQGLFYRNEESYFSLQVINNGYEIAYYPGTELIHNPSSVRIVSKEMAFLNLTNGFIIKRLFYPSEYFIIIYSIFLVRYIKKFGFNFQLIKRFLTRYRKIVKKENVMTLNRKIVSRLIDKFGFIRFINW